MQYIDQKPKVEKVVIASEEAMHNALDHKVLIGDQNKYPGAFLTFKIKVEPIFQPTTPGSSIGRYSSQLSRRSTQGKTFASAFEDSER